MARPLFGGMLLVLVLLWLLGANARVPESASQFAPPPTPRPGELSVSFSSAEVSRRLGVSVTVMPNQFVLENGTGHVDLVKGRPVVVFGDPALRDRLQSAINSEAARVGITYVRSVTLTQDQLLLIGR